MEEAILWREEDAGVDEAGAADGDLVKGGPTAGRVVVVGGGEEVGDDGGDGGEETTAEMEERWSETTAEMEERRSETTAEMEEVGDDGGDGGDGGDLQNDVKNKRKMEEAMLFEALSDDVVLKILSKLEEDPRNWGRLACVCSKFKYLVREVCLKNQCLSFIPAVVSDLLSSAHHHHPPGGWSSLHKIAVCCPGLVHSGVLLDNSDFGLLRDLGPEFAVETPDPGHHHHHHHGICTLSLNPNPAVSSNNSDQDCPWSLYDDLFYDTVYQEPEEEDSSAGGGAAAAIEKGVIAAAGGKRRRICRQMKSHVAAGAWNLSREQGSKLLHSRFRSDCLYICDWPGCVHIEEKRNYMLFRGVFRDFKGSQVWRTIKDGNRRKIDLNCAFCGCDDTWDLHSAFCLRRVFGFHEDGEPVVRAYVCENGHVSGAWTDLPLYT